MDTCTGLVGHSRIMQLDPTDNMQMLHSVPLLPNHLFGEGITAYHVYTTDASTGKRKKEDRVIQLTWTTQIGRIYTIPSLQLIHEFNYTTTTNEGWGITYIPKTNEFAISDGSEYITYWDANTLLETRKILVSTTLLLSTPAKTSDERSNSETRSATRIKYINELEFVNFHNDDNDAQSMTLTNSSGEDDDEDDDDNKDDDDNDNEMGNMQQQEQQQCREDKEEGYILANIWYEDVIVRIHPLTGTIDRIYDLSDLYPIEQRNVDGADCLNGIAVITTPDGTITRSTASTLNGGGGGGSVEVWVTGKLWPYMYRIELIG